MGTQEVTCIIVAFIGHQLLLIVDCVAEAYIYMCMYVCAYCKGLLKCERVA